MTTTPTQKAKGPVSVGALPDRASTQTRKGKDNMIEDSTAPAKPATSPSAKEYADAFYGLEDQVMRVARLAKVAHYLSAVLAEDCEKRPTGNHEYMSELTDTAVGEVLRCVIKIDDSYRDLRNALVDRENASRGLTA